MTPEFKVFVVEDDPTLRELFEMLLAESCQVVSFHDAESCLARLDAEKPDMFLLDVVLPGMDGYALCRHLKDDFETSDIPVTFVSGLDDIEARLAGYDAGGEDFICKPFEPEELLRKVRRAQRILKENRQLRDMAGYAQKTAFTAMSSMSELGVVIDFMRRSFACDSDTALGRQILASVEQFGLECAVQVRSEGHEHTFSAEGCDLPLETAVLNHVRTQGRIFEFKHRGVYNYGGITLLIKNMPLDDPDRCGRLRDDLAILAEGADARLQSIALERRNHRTRDGIGQALSELCGMLDACKRDHVADQEAGERLMLEMQEALIASFVSLGLTEAQEEDLTQLIHRYFARLKMQAHRGFMLADQLGAVTERLKQLA